MPSSAENKVAPSGSAKRLFDLGLAIVMLLVLSPIILVVALVVFLQDFRSPFFLGDRVGRDMTRFRMVKFRSMVVGADKIGAQSTATDDRRITPVGTFIRRFKLDELPQLFNIIAGQMSFVGPRPNVASEVELYTEAERHLLDVRPGITDFASIVFADEGTILAGSSDPDRDYNLLIRPWKSRLGLHYVASSSLAIDLRLMLLTALTMFDRRRALAGVKRLLQRTGAAAELVEVAGRSRALEPTPPPGISQQEWEGR